MKFFVVGLMSALFGVFLCSAIVPIAHAQITWTEVKPAENNGLERNWKASAMSRDGSILLAATNNSFEGGSYEVYRSTDGGESWLLAQMPHEDERSPWRTLSMDQTGQIMLAGNEGHLYLSKDTGESWQEVLEGQTNGRWGSSDMSADGRIMLAGTWSGGRLYLSSDFGETWNETQPLGDTQTWWMTASVSEGAELLIAGEGGNGLFRSTDAGASWTPIEIAGNFSWEVSCLSSDGAKVMVASDRDVDHVYLSNDAGLSWQAVVVDSSIEENPLWSTCSMSADGQSIIMAGSGYSIEGSEAVLGRVYFSADGGQTWSETQPRGDIQHWWSTSSMNENGRLILLGGISNPGEYEDGVYLGRLPAPPEEDDAPIGGTTPHLSRSRPKPPQCRKGAPTNTPDLFQVDVNNSQATLYFSPVNNADRYYISYGDGESTGQYGVEFVTGVSTGVIGYTINHLSPLQQYSFVVRGGNGCMPGDWGNHMTVTTRRSSAGGQSYYKSFISRVLSVFPQAITYVDGRRQVLGSASPTPQLLCNPNTAFVIPNNSILEDALTNFGALSVFQAFKQVIDLASLLLNPQMLNPQQSILTEQGCTSHT